MLFGKINRVYDLKLVEGSFKSLEECKFEDNTIYYFHYYYELHHGIKMLDAFDESHWEHIRTNDTVKFLFENCNETFTYELPLKIKEIIDLKKIQPEKIFMIVMDQVHKRFLQDRFAELRIEGITIGVYNDLLKKTMIQTEFPRAKSKFSALSRNYRSWRLHLYAALERKNLLKDFTYSFYNIWPYGEVKYFDINTMRKDLSDTNFGTIDENIENWLAKVPYTLEDTEDNVLNKWGDATYNAVLSADFHLLVETHFDLFYYVHNTDGVYRRELAPSSITEKTNKPIACRKPFIAFSTPFFLEDLRQLGFETFHPFIDESYDKEVDNFKRLNMIVAEVERLITMPEIEYNKVVTECTSIASRNLEKLVATKSQTFFNPNFDFLKDYLDPSANIRIL